jgi:hypothetical protein
MFYIKTLVLKQAKICFSLQLMKFFFNWLNLVEFFLKLKLFIVRILDLYFNGETKYFLDLWAMSFSKLCKMERGEIKLLCFLLQDAHTQRVWFIGLFLEWFIWLTFYSCFVRSVQRRLQLMIDYLKNYRKKFSWNYLNPISIYKFVPAIAVHFENTTEN